MLRLRRSRLVFAAQSPNDASIVRLELLRAERPSLFGNSIPGSTESVAGFIRVGNIRVRKDGTIDAALVHPSAHGCFSHR